MRQAIRTCLIGLTLAAAAAAEDWPRCGPRGDGTWAGPKLPAKWPEGGLRTVWKQPIGGGYAGVTVAGGRVYTMDLEKPSDANAPKDQPDGHEPVLCFDAATGRPLWSHRYPVRYGGLGGYGNGPRAAPTYHDGRLYTLGAVGHVFCFDAKTGEVLWAKDMVREFDARVPEWGFAASPVIDGDRVLIHAGPQADGSLMAFDRRTGEEVWRSLPDPAGYCTPVVIDSAPSGRQVVIWTPENVRGVEAATGKLLWTVPYKVTYGVSIATPIYREGIVFVTGYWEGSKAIRLGEAPTDAEVIWENTRECGLMAQPLYRDGYVYSIDKGNGLTCFELKTGRKLWDDDNAMTPRGRNPHASFVWAGDGDRILSLNADGELILARLSPEGYAEQSRTKVLSGQVWSHPAFAGRFLFARTDGAHRWRGAGPLELVCVELAGE